MIQMLLPKILRVLLLVVHSLNHASYGVFPVITEAIAISRVSNKPQSKEEHLTPATI